MRLVEILPSCRQPLNGEINTALKNGDISQEQYDALQREIIETEQDLKKLEAQANQSATALQKTGTAGEKLKTVGDNMQ